MPHTMIGNVEPGVTEPPMGISKMVIFDKTNARARQTPPTAIERIFSLFEVFADIKTPPFGNRPASNPKGGNPC